MQLASLNFYPRSPRGERLFNPFPSLLDRFISIHAPRVGSDLYCSSVQLYCALFLSTLPAWGATWCGGVARLRKKISIHAPRVGSDTGGLSMYHTTTPISIHAPRVGSDGELDKPIKCDCDFYPRSPRGERPPTLIALTAEIEISIHAPRVGSDGLGDVFLNSNVEFLSTLPAWGATLQLLNESCIVSDFYPRSPRGERQVMQKT